MAKYDGLEKYLGRDDKFPSEEIEQEVSAIDPAPLVNPDIPQASANSEAEQAHDFIDTVSENVDLSDPYLDRPTETAPADLLFGTEGVQELAALDQADAVPKARFTRNPESIANDFAQNAAAVVDAASIPGADVNTNELLDMDMDNLVDSEEVSSDPSATPADEANTVEAEAPDLATIESPDLEVPDLATIESPDLEVPDLTTIESPDLEVPDLATIESPDLEVPDLATIESPDLEVPDLAANLAPTEPARFRMAPPPKIAGNGQRATQATPAAEATNPLFPQVDDSYLQPVQRQDLPSDLSPIRETDLQDSNLSSVDDNVGSYLQPLQLDEETAERIREAINELRNPNLRSRVRSIFLGDAVEDPAFLGPLVEMLLRHDKEADIARFIQEQVPADKWLNTVETPATQEAKVAPPVVLYSPGVQRFKQLQKEIRNSGLRIGLLLSVILAAAVLIWRFIVMPIHSNVLYDQGLLAIGNGQYEWAEDRFYTAFAQTGPSPRRFIEYSKAYESVGALSTAEHKLLEGLSLKRDNLDLIDALTDFYKQQGTLGYQKAVEVLLQLHKDDLPWNIVDRLGYLYLEWGDLLVDPAAKIAKYNLANQIYQSYMLDHTRFLTGYYRLLEVAMRSDNAERVNALYDSVEKYSKNNKKPEVGTLTRLSQYYFDKEMWNEAKEVITRMVRFANAHQRRIPAVQKLLAEQQGMKASDAEPLLSQIYYQYGRLLLLEGSLTKARDAARTSIDVMTASAPAWNLLGEVTYLMSTDASRVQQAQGYFDKAIAHDPNYAKAYVNLGHLFYYESPIFTNVSEALDRSLEYYRLGSALSQGEPLDFLAEYNRGWLEYRQSNYQRAFEPWSQLYAQDAEHPILSYALANSYYHLNHKDMAQMELDKVIEYYGRLSKGITFVNPEVPMHIQTYTLLAQAYNNRAVIAIEQAQQNGPNRPRLEEQALLDIMRGKDAAGRLGMIHAPLEYNLRVLQGTSLGPRQPEYDSDVPQRISMESIREQLLRVMRKP